MRVKSIITNLGMIFLVVSMLTVLVEQGGITSYAIIEQSEELNLTVSGEETYQITISEKELASLRISGTLFGEGKVLAYVKHFNETFIIVNQTVTSNATIEEADEVVVEKSNKNKSINLSLNYENKSIWDKNNNGVESYTGVIDLTVENTMFSWDVNKSNLCTRWQVESLDSNTQTTICNGKDLCCGLLELKPISNNWNDIFYLNHNKYNSSFE